MCRSQRTFAEVFEERIATAIGAAMISVETAAALILATIDSVEHRQSCLRVQELPCELFAEALSVLGADGEDVREARQWFADHGVQLQPRASSWYVRRSNNQVSEEVEAHIRELLGRGMKRQLLHERFV
jgi:hypothetical protein